MNRRVDRNCELANDGRIKQGSDPFYGRELLPRVCRAPHQELAQLHEPALAEPGEVDDAAEGVEALRVADFVGRLLAADVLLAGLHAQNKPAAPVDVVPLA